MLSVAYFKDCGESIAKLNVAIMCTVYAECCYSECRVSLIFMLSVVNVQCRFLNIIVNTESLLCCYHAESQNAGCHHSKSRFCECHHAECRYTE
jgi:hypothetical protein